jgi:hypothetical protein
MRAHRSCRSILLGAVLAAGLALLAQPLGAQQTTRDLSGTVTDRGREPLRGAVVQLENERTHAVISYITGRSGEYSFKRIGGDTDYEVWATFRGIRSKEKQLDRFNVKHTPRIDLVIELR